MGNDQFLELIKEIRTINSRLDDFEAKIEGRFNKIDVQLFSIQENIERIAEWVPFRTPPLKFKEKIEA